MYKAKRLETRTYRAVQLENLIFYGWLMDLQLKIPDLKMNNAILFIDEKTSIYHSGIVAIELIFISL